MPTCRCFPGWTGPLCDSDIDECVDHSGPCINGGRCENLPGNFTCHCPNNYLGLFCEIEDLCFKNFCLNDAECRQIDLARYECICKHGFTGSNCEKVIGPCHVNPCKNGGICIEESGSSARCQCGSDYKVYSNKHFMKKQKILSYGVASIPIDYY
uniref:EGF-like domain-containing protein n=1 Tax=Romanomermis culicivorax TaxID=13658 RepID=A0A915KM42_ROMCU